MSYTHLVEHWCPECEKLYQSTVTIERVGHESTRIESPCPTCGTPGETFLRIPGR